MQVCMHGCAYACAFFLCVCVCVRVRVIAVDVHGEFPYSFFFFFLYPLSHTNFPDGRSFVCCVVDLLKFETSQCLISGIDLQTAMLWMLLSWNA